MLGLQIVGVLRIADVPTISAVIHRLRPSVRNQKLQPVGITTLGFHLQRMVTVLSQISPIERVSPIEREWPAGIDFRRCAGAGRWRRVSRKVEVQSSADTAYIGSRQNKLRHDLALNLDIPLLGTRILLLRIPEVGHCPPRNACRNGRKRSRVYLSNCR